MTIVEEVLEYAEVTTRHQRRAMIELAFLQEMFGERFQLSGQTIGEHVQWRNHRKFLQTVQELVHAGQVVCEQGQRYTIVRTWDTLEKHK